MQRTFDVYADPGHAWVKVHLDVVEALGLTAGHFSGYSYRNGPTLFLEEDSDLSFFAKVYREKTGEAPKWREHQGRKTSRIRRYMRIAPTKAYYDRFHGEGCGCPGKA